MHCYLSAAAVRQYMTICGYAVSDFDRAAVELEKLCEQATLARDVGEPLARKGAVQQSQLWRVKATVSGKRTRLELIVSIEPRAEGPLPQLVAVRNKGA